MGFRDHPTAPRSPWQNGHVERLIGSIRRQSLDHLVVFDEARRIFGARRSLALSHASRFWVGRITYMSGFRL